MKYPTYGGVTTITMTKKELLTLLFKLERPDSARTLMRRGEDGQEYAITAIPDTDKDHWFLHPLEEAMLKQYKRIEARLKGNK